jgi:hypothetical protein
MKENHLRRFCVSTRSLFFGIAHGNSTCLDLQRKAWRSSVYDHFQPPVIVEVKGEILYRFICKRCVIHFSSIIYLIYYTTEIPASLYNVTGLKTQRVIFQSMWKSAHPQKQQPRSNWHHSQMVVLIRHTSFAFYWQCGAHDDTAPFLLSLTQSSVSYLRCFVVVLRFHTL